MNLLGLALLMISCSVPAAAQLKENAVDKLVRKNYPGFHLLRMSERDADVRTFLTTRSQRSNPSLVHADFDGDGHLDYALLLKSDRSAAAELSVLLCENTERCHAVYKIDITGASEIAYLSRIPPSSKIAEMDDAGENDPHAVKLKKVGVSLSYFEKAEIALYWDKKLKKIVEVGVED
jgi:hypothetical protein